MTKDVKKFKLDGKLNVDGEDMKIKGTGKLSFNTSWKKFEWYDEILGIKEIKYLTNGYTDGQTFTIGTVGKNIDITLKRIKVKIEAPESDIGNAGIDFIVTATDGSGKPIYTGPGDILSSGKLNWDDITHPGEIRWYFVMMTETQLDASTTYAILAQGTSGKYGWEYDDNGNGYAGGGRATYGLPGWGLILIDDYQFEVWGIPVTLSDWRGQMKFKVKESLPT